MGCRRTWAICGFAPQRPTCSAFRRARLSRCCSDSFWYICACPDWDSPASCTPKPASHVTHVAPDSALQDFELFRNKGGVCPSTACVLLKTLAWGPSVSSSLGPLVPTAFALRLPASFGPSGPTAGELEHPFNPIGPPIGTHKQNVKIPDFLRRRGNVWQREIYARNKRTLFSFQHCHPTPRAAVTHTRKPCKLACSRSPNPHSFSPRLLSLTLPPPSLSHAHTPQYTCTRDPGQRLQRTRLHAKVGHSA